MCWFTELLYEAFPPLNERAQGWLRSELAEPGADWYVFEDETETNVRGHMAKQNNERNKRVLELTADGKLSYQAVGDMLGMTRQAVGAVVFRNRYSPPRRLTAPKTCHTQPR